MGVSPIDVNALIQTLLPLVMMVMIVSIIMDMVKGLR